MEKDFEGKKLLVVNAHPDDEMGYASVLAHYAARGARVRIVSATLGQKGFRDHTGIDDGEELARVRREELETASRVLGLDPPIALEFVDKELLGAVQDRVRQRIAEVLDELRPDAVITFGPDGVTGHVDHRAVSSFVTEIVQARERGPRLYYFALPLAHVAAVAERTGRTFLGVADRHLTTRVVVSDEDVERGIEAIGTYRSQFAPAAMERVQSGFRATTKEVYFRQALPVPTGDGGVERTLSESLFEGV
jgi:LmbE family N-acetylglucosaminyl deacetylase